MSLVAASFGVALLLSPCQAASVHGLVLGPDNKPVPNAAISWFDGRTTSNMMGEMVMDHRETHSDAEGRFTFETQDDALFFRSAGEVAYVRISAPGMALTGQTVNAGETTIHLKSGISRTGTLLDAEGHPMAGIKVRLSSLLVTDEKPIFFENPDVRPQAITDAQGHFTFSGLNPDANLVFALSDDKYFVPSALYAKGTGQLPPLFAREGATVSGTLRDNQGQPLVGTVSYYSQAGGPQQVKTDAQGAFTMHGIPVGQNQLWVTAQNKALIFTPQTFTPLKAGENRQLAPFVAKPGVELHGKFVDAITKAPVGQVAVTSSNAPVVSKEDGTFSTYVSDTAVYLSYSAAAQGYFESSIDDMVTTEKLNITPETKSIDVGTIELKKGIRLQGKVEIEGGTLPRSLALNWVSTNDTNSAYSDLAIREDGSFASPVLHAGHYDLKLLGYDIISPTSIEVKDKDNPPLVLKLRRKPVNQTTVKGRVVDANGQPIAGALVTVTGMDLGINQLATDLEGTFIIEGQRLSLEATEPAYNLNAVQHPLYAFQKGSFSFEKGTLKATDIVMVPKDGQLSGRVVDVNGQGVAGVWVAPLETSEVAPVKTGADGSFALTALPHTETTWLFAQGKRFGTVKITPNATNLGWRLPEALTRANDEALAAQLKTQKLNFARLSAIAPMIGWENMETAALAADDALGPDGQGLEGKGKKNWERFLTAQKKYHPQQLALHAQEYAKIGGDEIELATYAARIGDDKAKAWAKTVWEREGGKQMTLTINSEAITKALRIAILGHSFNDTKANQWLQLALTLRDQLNKPSRFESSDVWGQQLAFSNEDWQKQWLEDASKAEKFEFLRGKIAMLAIPDTTRAQQLYPQMIALSKDAEVHGLVTGKGELHPEDFDLAQQISVTTRALTRVLATTEPKKAQEMLAQIARSYSDTGAYFEVARGALALHDTETARAALKKVVESDYVSTEDRALAGALASSFDQDWGTQLMEAAQPRDSILYNYESIASWALYNAPIDAGLSRIKLEREWYTRMQSAQKATNDDYDPNAMALGPLAVAMTVVDGNRAIEWLNALPNKQGIDPDYFRASIYTLLLADETTRATWNVRNEMR